MYTEALSLEDLANVCGGNGFSDWVSKHGHQISTATGATVLGAAGGVAGFMIGGPPGAVAGTVAGIGAGSTLGANMVR